MAEYRIDETVDITDVVCPVTFVKAKVALEEQPGGLPKDAPKVRAARAMLFGGWEGNWMAWNMAHDVKLPQAPDKYAAFHGGDWDSSQHRTGTALGPCTAELAKSARSLRYERPARSPNPLASPHLVRRAAG